MPITECSLVRVPLQTGASSLRSLASGATSIALSIGFVVFANDFLPGLDPAIRWALVGSGALVPVFAFAPLRRFWFRRPSDLVFLSERFRIEGGQQDGLTLAYADIHPNQCTVEEALRKNYAGLHTSTLLVNGQKLASADEDEEVQSLEEVRSAILSRVPRRGSKVEADQETFDDIVLVCPSCTAPIVPTNDEVSQCKYCGVDVPIPEELRARVIAAEKCPDNEIWVSKALTKLLDQPAAPVVTKRIVLSFLISICACPIALGVYELARHRHVIGMWLGVGLASLPFLLIVIGYLVARLPITDRHAARGVMFGFGARAPALRKGSSPRCRRCGAPLPASVGIVVHCVYCQSANILGLDLRSRAQDAELSKSSLQPALATRAEERSVWTSLVVLGSVMSIALTVVVLVGALR